ncbi:alpha/beta fold hydrolase [Candidatus Saccharibacteria bacterium]|nr:alpha/beta fold hydrolase [Candidatus Saccharibacteria bacterium]
MTPLEKQLTLKKTHDFASAKEPELAVVLIHGIASDSTTFTNALKYLEGLKSLQKVRFITFDLLGAGKSLKDDRLNYDYKDQLRALHQAIQKLRLDIPLVLVGHSLGTFIVTKYADVYKKSVKKLVLVSPPIYTEKDLDNPAFEAGIKVFKDAVSLKNRKILAEKAFNNSMEKIVLNRKNYQVLAELKTPTVLIYGNMDQFIASYNIPKILKANPEYLTAIKTEGRHGVSRDKYTKLVNILEEVLNA